MYRFKQSVAFFAGFNIVSLVSLHIFFFYSVSKLHSHPYYSYFYYSYFPLVCGISKYENNSLSQWLANFTVL